MDWFTSPGGEFIETPDNMYAIDPQHFEFEKDDYIEIMHTLNISESDDKAAVNFINKEVQTNDKLMIIVCYVGDDTCIIWDSINEWHECYKEDSLCVFSGFQNELNVYFYYKK